MIHNFYVKVYVMNDLLIRRLATVEEAAYIRQERRAGDPSREPDETTEDDVIEALLRQKAPFSEIIREKDICTIALRHMIQGIDQQG
jgi:hypothetical protein